MITITNVETYGWEAAIRGMRNPMNSWDKSDSAFGRNLEIPYSQNNPTTMLDKYGVETYIGDNDLDLMKRLVKAGTDHRKFMRMITVFCDITAPLYWWKEFDTYKVGTVANSCSTMHKIADKEFTLDDFSHEHVIDFFNDIDVFEYMNDDRMYDFEVSPLIIVETMHDEVFYEPMGILELQIKMLNKCRELYLKTKDKKYWWQMIQLLPNSYNQKRTVMLNYEVLANMYKSRNNHKLDEWHALCDWIEELPYSKLITEKSYRNRLQDQIEAGKN